MLILTRRKEETIRINNDITIKVVEINNRHVRLGIDAPKHVLINREEVYQRILAANKAACSESEPKAKLNQVAEMLKDREDGSKTASS
jgi:carbon storage regulator